MEKAHDPFVAGGDELEQFAADVVQRIFAEELPVEQLEIQFATDGMYLVKVTERGYPAGPQLPIARPDAAPA